MIIFIGVMIVIGIDFDVIDIEKILKNVWIFCIGISLGNV